MVLGIRNSEPKMLQSGSYIVRSMLAGDMEPVCSTSLLQRRTRACVCFRAHVRTSMCNGVTAYIHGCTHACGSEHICVHVQFHVHMHVLPSTYACKHVQRHTLMRASCSHACASEHTCVATWQSVQREASSNAPQTGKATASGLNHWQYHFLSLFAYGCPPEDMLVGGFHQRGFGADFTEAFIQGRSGRSNNKSNKGVTTHDRFLPCQGGGSSMVDVEILETR